MLTKIFSLCVCLAVYFFPNTEIIIDTAESNIYNEERQSYTCTIVDGGDKYMFYDIYCMTGSKNVFVVADDEILLHISVDSEVE